MGDVAHARALLEETTLPYQFDLVLHDAENKTLQEHVRQYGKVIVGRVTQATDTPLWRKSTWGNEVRLEYGKALRIMENFASMEVMGPLAGQRRLWQMALVLFSVEREPIGVSNTPESLFLL